MEVIVEFRKGRGWGIRIRRVFGVMERRIFILRFLRRIYRLSLVRRF